jgi:hypothetical protein
VRKDHIVDHGLEHAPQLALGPHAAATPAREFFLIVADSITT